MKTGYKRLIILLSILLLALAGGWYYTQVYQTAQAESTPELQTARVRTGDIVISASGAGNVVAAQEADLGFRSGGVLTELNVGVGDSVEVGQTFARLDDTSARLQLQQAQINLQALISPIAIIEAQVAALNAETDLEEAVEGLEYLISPYVWRWETQVEAAGTELEKLQADLDADDDALAEAQLVLETAQANLTYAEYLYTEEYVPSTFTYTYSDPVTGEEVEGLFPPSEAEIALARAKVASIELALKEAQTYEEQLTAGQPCGETAEITAAAGTSLSRLEQACLAIEEAELALENTVLVSPLAGTVTQLSASVGQSVGTAPIVTITTTDHLLVRFYMDENDLGSMATGYPTVLTFDAFPDEAVSGEVIQVDPTLVTIDGTTVVQAWASFETDLSLIPGMAVDVEVIAGEAQDARLAPVQALRELSPGSYAVFVVGADGQLELRPVEVGLKDFANAQILSGLEPGEMVSTGTIETAQ